ncbi:5'-3' exoribonuclease 2-like [Sorghum bicolor]|uniref:5'-3' exoribonuclease 2-like n=1 Tax=Sorghum bicolor TaxID=4558 RepID=UPI000B423A4D|nr:5'-3' exoribonuclease 2-like [Sorghum bicolor]|eukprot:XP_021308790.1 5'-3' exoribonuclease 2-like [Sorghum bicolor]
MAPEHRDLWVAIADLFQANKAPRAVFLAEQFHSMTQGDLSIDQFCQRMKQTADSLHDVGHTILDSQLVLNLLRGLNPRYSSTADDIVNKDVLPSFAAARNMLVLKELRLANESKVQTGTALLAGPPSSSTCTNASCRSSNSGSPAAPPQQRAGNSGSRGGGSGGGRNNNNRRGGRRGNGQQQQQAGGHWQQAAQPAGPGFCFSPAAFQTGQRPAWHPPGGPGVLGQAPQAHTAFAPLQYSMSAPPPQQQQWDPTALVAALNQMSMNQGGAPWVMDTGATAHMHSHDGSSDQSGDASLQ